MQTETTAADAVVEKQIDARPEIVFSYFVEPDKMLGWFGREAHLEARPGGEYRVRLNDQARAMGEFVELDPPRRVVFTFGWEGDAANGPGKGTIEVTLTPEGEGTHERLVHRGLSDGTQEEHRDGWQYYLDRLAIRAVGGDPGPDKNAGPLEG
jgi:uncharacterized protein YndB with AHSA1/START domain